jgi:tetratricopeptide (TPR) repeat protein
LNAAIENLRAHSLLGRSRSTQTLSIHRLDQAVLEDTMDEAARTLWAERAVRVVNAAFPQVEFATWPQCERLLPQALVCAEHIEHRQLTFPGAARLLNDTAVYLDNQGRYPEAEPLYEQALAIREQQLGPEHPHTADSLNNLAGLYHAQGKYEQAEPLLRRALAIYEQRLGAKHPATRTIQSNYDKLLRAMGKRSR